MTTTQFSSDEKKGLEAVKAFCAYLKSQGINYRLATTQEQYEGKDIITDTATYEVKYQTIDNSVVVEESSMQRLDGWIYSSQADYLVEVNGNTITIITMQELKDWYYKCMVNYKLQYNDETKGVRGDIWRSRYRIIPLNDIRAFVSVKIITNKRRNS